MRFATARDVAMAYPQVALGFRSPLGDTGSLSYVERLGEEGNWPDAIALIAHLLRRREAVWWASRCVRSAISSLEPSDEKLIAAAERWVEAPDEQSRQAVLALAETADLNRPAGWVARAAGWSGGVLAERGDEKLMCEPHMSHAAARGAVLLAGSLAADPNAYLRGCVNSGLALLKRDSSG